MLRGLALVAHRAMLRTARSPLRLLWALAYRALLRVVVGWVAWREPEASAYVRASFGFRDQIYGLSDLDVALVVSGDPNRVGDARDRLLGRWQRLCGLFPWLGDAFDLAVYEDTVLADAVAAPTLTYELARPAPAGSIPRSTYFGPQPLYDGSALRERPRVYGPLSDWRRYSGPDRLPAVPAYGPQERRIAAWLELQAYWVHAFRACVNPGSPGRPYLCVKLVAEPARIWLWLVHGEQVLRRVDVLHRALEVLPEEEHAFRRALELYRALPRTTEAPLAEFMPPFVRLSARLAERIAQELRSEGATDVGLTGRDEPLVLAGNPGEERTGRLLPLADWRGLVWPSLPDETFAPAEGDPGDPGVLAALATRGEAGPYPALRTGGLMIFPTTSRGLLRAVQCPATDPVSFALADGTQGARFPDVPGWAARDWARRAVAEHWAWLRFRRDSAPVTSREWPDREARRQSAPLRGLGRLFTAARAALFLESVEEDAPELAVTVAGVAARLGERRPDAEAVASAAYDEYRDARGGGRAPSERTIAALRREVFRLPPYARAAEARAEEPTPARFHQPGSG